MLRNAPIYLTRDNLVGKYLGKTGGLVMNLLSSYRGRTVVIKGFDHIPIGDDDVYGKEARVAVTQYMMQHPDQSIILD